MNKQSKDDKPFNHVKIKRAAPHEWRFFYATGGFCDVMTAFYGSKTVIFLEKTGLESKKTCAGNPAIKQPTLIKRINARKLPPEAVEHIRRQASVLHRQVLYAGAYCRRGRWPSKPGLKENDEKQRLISHCRMNFHLLHSTILFFNCSDFSRHSSHRFLDIQRN